MGMLDKVATERARRSGMDRADPVTLEEFGALLSRSRGFVKSRTGITVTDDRALGLTAWWSGVRYLTETVASLPLHIYRTTGRSRVRRADPPWLERPDVELSRFQLLEFYMFCMLHRGNFFAFKNRDGLERVVGLRILHPDRVRVGQASDGTKVFEVRNDNDQPVGLTTREVLHITGMSKDGIVGMNPIRVHAESLGIAAAADQFAGSYFSSASHPSGVISVNEELTEPEANRLKAEWERFHQGLRNAQQVGVLSKGSTYSSISLKAEDAQLLQSRQYGVIEVARILRVPPHKLYELSRATFSNIEQQAIEGVMDSIRPWLVRFEAAVRFDRDLLARGTYAEFLVEGLYRGDIKTRYEAYRNALHGGWMEPAEIREKENLNEIPGTHYLNVPLNMMQIGPDAPEVPEKAEVQEQGEAA